jgi:hypothetical protein
MLASELAEKLQQWIDKEKKLVGGYPRLEAMQLRYELTRLEAELKRLINDAS